VAVSSKPPAPDAGTVNAEILAKLLELQQQTSDQVIELRKALKVQRAAKGPRKRRGPVAYSPPDTSPGAEPSEMQRAWARKLLRQYGWR
jgi:hypothetical protein